MMKRLLTIACLSVFIPALAVAEPTADQLKTRQAELQKKLTGQGFTVVVNAPFVVITDEPGAALTRRINFINWTAGLIEKDFFSKRPDKLIEIWLFKNERTYRAGAKKYFNDTPETPFGYYSPDKEALVMNIGPGAGTLSHELVHPYMESNFPAVPAWFNEGLASLYEQPREKNGHMWGSTNWRLPGLQKMIRNKTIPSVETLLSTSRDGFYEAAYDSYAYARFLCQYLQDHGKLRDFYKKFHADQKKDPTGKASLAAILGTDLASFDVVFRKWAANLRR